MPTTDFTLLYVEDDRESQRQMKLILEDSVKKFYQAYNGEEGLKIFKEKNPDIILTDINMPVLDGLSMVKQIKELDATKPIMLMSAFEDKRYLSKAISMKIDFFVSKPINIDILENGLKAIAKKLQNKISTIGI